jgi:hypothetical protein
LQLDDRQHHLLFQGVQIMCQLKALTRYIFFLIL